jgi:branched-chain amino acid transport system substrate-binding protein
MNVTSLRNAQYSPAPFLTAAALGMLGIAALSGCVGKADARQAGAADSLYIGVAAAHATGEQYFRGVQLAVDRLNAERKSGARPFAMRKAPEQQETQVAVAAFFRDDPAVIGVVGHTGSAQTVEAAPIYADVERNGRRAVLAITPTATNAAVTRDGGWVFRVCPTDSDGAHALAQFVVDSLGARRVAVLYRNDLFGRGYLRAFSRTVQDGGAIVTHRDPYLAGITEFRAYAARLQRDPPDVLVVAGGSMDLVAMVRELRKIGAQIPTVGTDDIGSLNQDTALAREFAGVRFTAFFQPTSNASPETRKFLDTYLTTHNKLPEQQAALAYDAAMVIGRAALAVGPDRERVRGWVANLTGGRAHDGVTGPIRFNARGDVVGKPVFVGEVRP